MLTEDAESELQNHPPEEPRGEILALLCLVVAHDEETLAEQQRENAVHFSRKQHRENVEHRPVVRQRVRDRIGLSQVEMLHRMVENDPRHGQPRRASATSIRQLSMPLVFYIVLMRCKLRKKE